MSANNTRCSHHRDQDAAISAVALAGATSAQGHSPGVHMQIDVDRAFLTMRWAGGADMQQSLSDSCTTNRQAPFEQSFLEVNMFHKRPQPPQPDRIRSICGSFSWIDHRFFRQGFDRGLTRVEKLLYLVLIAVSNRDGVSFYSDERLAELIEIRHSHELTGARSELVARDLIAFKDGIYQVLDLPAGS